MRPSAVFEAAIDMQRWIAVESYVWRVKRKPVEVRLTLPMLRYMLPWLRERASGTPDALGVLLGRVRRRWTGDLVVVVEDFEPFDPATLRGRPKAPPGTDLHVVGLYRRRPGDELKLDHLDASLIQSSFVHRGMVYLLISASDAGPDRATFFIQERGDVHGYANYGEFPFDAAFLENPRLGRKRSPPVRWIPVAGLVVSLIALAGWFAWLRQQQSPAPSASATSAPSAQTPQAAAPAVQPEGAASREGPAARTKHRKTKSTRKRRHLVS